MENLAGPSYGQGQAGSRFYVFHSYNSSAKCSQVNGNTIPSKILKYRYLYHENTDIINSEFLNLSKLPIGICKQILCHMNLNGRTKHPSILCEVIYCLFYHKFGNLYTYDNSNKFGKWMMFFEKIKGTEGFDEKWKECCRLYDEGKLKGIAALMCTTGFIPPEYEANNSNMGAIFFFCGPKDDIQKILEYGNQLKQVTQYYTAFGQMFYHSFSQYSGDGSGPLYSIPVPKGSSSRLYYINSYPLEIIELEGNIIPTDILTRKTKFLYHENAKIVNSIPNRHTLPFAVCNKILYRTDLTLNLINDDENTKAGILCEVIYNFLYYRNPNLNQLFPYEDTNKLGKWMMFFKKIEGVNGFNEKWMECCQLYEEGKLKGIASIMCTTGFNSFEYTENNSDKGAIFFFCGPKNNRQTMLEYGENLLQLIPYCNTNGYMYYKSYEHSMDGEAGWLHEIPVPKGPPGRFYSYSFDSNPPIVNELKRNIMPTKIRNDKFLYHENVNIVNSELLNIQKWPFKACKQILRYINLNLIYDDKNTKAGILCEVICNNLIQYNSEIIKYIPYNKSNRLGKWMMFFKKIDGVNGFDEKWMECCKLYEEGKLKGIVALMCTTGFIPRGYRDYNNDGIGTIFFLCGPKDNVSSILKYGENLLQLIPYHSPYGNIYYKSYEHSLESEEGSLCKIPVPFCPTECRHSVHCRQQLSVMNNPIIIVD